MDALFETETLAQLPVTVLGGGRSGLAACQALAQRGARPFLSDAGPLSNEAKATLQALNVPYEEHGHSDRALVAELWVVSPGIPWSHSALDAARARGIPIWGELELGYRLCPSRRLIAITGTNGKSTTTRLVGALLAARGHHAPTGGNLGTPLCALLDEIAPRSWVVLEVSSFQLESVRAFRPCIGVWLNLAPDHLDRHGDLARYGALKARLFANQTGDDHAVLGPGLRLPAGGKARVHRFEPPPSPPPVALPDHQCANVAAATAAARLADPDITLDEVDLRALLQRQHCLAYVGRAGGVGFYNDSKATNPHATLAALDALKDQGPVCVILGGCDKGTDPAPLAHYIATHPAMAQAVLVGPFAPYWQNALTAAGFHRFTSAKSLEDALRLLDAEVRTCVLSPAGASFDQFANYQARGAAFEAAVNKLRIS